MDIKKNLSKVLLVSKEKIIIFSKFAFNKTKIFICFLGRELKIFFIFVGKNCKILGTKIAALCLLCSKKVSVYANNKKQQRQAKKLTKQQQPKEVIDKKLLKAKHQPKEKTPEEEEKKKKAIIITLGIIIILILLFLLLSGIRSCGNSSKVRDKENAITFATKYSAKGEFDRALDKLDDFLQKYGDDQDIWDLWNKILEAKNLAEQNGNGNSSLQGEYPDNFSFDIDTSGLSDAMKDALDETRRQAEENRRAMEDLMRMQQQNPNASGNNGNNNSNGLSDDQKAIQDKLAEERRLADEKKRAEEEKLANQNADLKKKLDAMNNELQKGKDALKNGNINKANEHFRNALANVPNIPENPNFYSDKQSDIAQYFADAADNTSNPNDKKELMNQAVNYANNALKQNPNDGQAHNILGQNALNNKDYAGAEKEFGLATNQKDDPNRYLYYYNLGKVQYILKKYQDAQKSFTISCDLKGDFAPSRYNLGITNKQLKNITGALNAFKKTVQIDPYHEKAFLEQARILAERNDLLGAIDAYKSVLKINSVNAAAAMELGSAYYKRMNYQDAIDSYKRAITMLSPGEQMTLTKYNLATALYDNGNINDSFKYAKEAYDSKDYVKNNASKANVVYTYALLLDKTQRQTQAIPVYNESLKLNPNHNKTKINLGNLYMSSNPPLLDTAMQLYKEVYDNERTNFEANNNLGSLYLAKNDYNNAIKFYQNALKIQPKNNEVRENLAKTYAITGDYESAKITYTDLVKSDRTNWDAYIELAKVCMQLGQNDLADEYLTYVQVNNPSYRKVDINNLLEAIQ